MLKQVDSPQGVTSSNTNDTKNSFTSWKTIRAYYIFNTILLHNQPESVVPLNYSTWDTSVLRCYGRHTEGFFSEYKSLLPALMGIVRFLQNKLCAVLTI